MKPEDRVKFLNNISSENMVVEYENVYNEVLKKNTYEQ